MRTKPEMDPKSHGQADGLMVSLGAGSEPMAGFIRVDIDPSTSPDRVMDIRKLDFKDGSVSILYASHVLEHIKQEASNRWAYLVELLRGWRRCLAANGRLFVAVPDVVALSKLFLEHTTEVDIHKTIIDSLFGGGRNPHDFHFSGFTEPLLKSLLLEAGFGKVERFEPFFQDETRHSLLERSISLNLVAYNSDSAETRDSRPLPSLTLSREATRLEELEKAANERLQLIVKLNKDCVEKEEVIQSLAKACREREEAILTLTQECKKRDEEIRNLKTELKTR